MAHRPLILSPAGSPDAFYAALDAGADEIYFGLGSHNARKNAKNFTDEEMAHAIKSARLMGVKTNITLNTLISDREFPEAINLAYKALCLGADAFIVQDLGLARALKKTFPEICLHASTQCACHSESGAKALIDAGFERIVLARELNVYEIEKIASLGVETEVFVHGALCVCHSGMCLMSSVIGKRSGNRGLCAQPCRLPYEIDSKHDASHFPLSLKDLSLAGNISEIQKLGITALKIEGRMKGPDYVSGVTSIWKSLVLENRNATPEEYELLEKLFSRSGFTDGYFTGSYLNDNRDMYGVRTDEDKTNSQKVSLFKEAKLKREIEIHAVLAEGKKAVVSAFCKDDPKKACQIESDFLLESASSMPITENDIYLSLTKLGNTLFSCNTVKTKLEGRIFVPKSSLNGLRRQLISALEQKILETKAPPEIPDTDIYKTTSAKQIPERTLFRLFPDSFGCLLDMLNKYPAEKCECVFLPYTFFVHNNKEVFTYLTDKNIPFGIKLPRVIFTAEQSTAKALLEKAKASGAVCALAENIGHIALIKDAGLEVYAGAGLNIYNSQAVEYLESIGVKSVTLSPELLTAQMRDISVPAGMTSAIIASGRLELMVLESCILKASGKCRKDCSAEGHHFLHDRKNTDFPIKPEIRLSENPYPCRNIILNSVPLSLIQKPDELKKTRADIYCIYPD